MTWMTCHEDGRSGGIVYTYLCGHTHHMTKEEIHAYIRAKGKNVPSECPKCKGVKG